MNIAVALSGGVDSAVAAALLQQQGHQVTGFFMKNWTDVAEAKYRKDECPWLVDYEDAQRVCAHLGIKCELVNLEREYRDHVFKYFLDEYKAGRTPNPDVLCNTEIKFKSFLKVAEERGFDKMATGHYARITDRNTDRNTDTADAMADFADVKYFLKKGVDSNKDQSYFIYHLTQRQLSKLLFPIGGYEKADVRKLAEQFNLPVAKKKDSQGLCFVGEIDFPTFLEQYIPHTPGPMITVEGEPMGAHKGLEYYTMGQRYGLEIGGSGPYYVVDKDITTNTLTICQGADHPSLLSDWFTIEDEFWVSGQRIDNEFSCSVKVRYRSPDVACTISGKKITLEQPERAVTPGQFAIFYDGDTVLGGGVIFNRERRFDNSFDTIIKSPHE